MTTRCDRHRTTDPAPRLCPTCQRIAVEDEIVTRTIDALLAAGYRLMTDMQAEPRPAEPTADRAAILAEVFEVDDEFLGVFRAEDFTPADRRPFGWIRFVYGNDGYDVICDYTVNLETVLAPVNAFADTLSV